MPLAISAAVFVVLVVLSGLIVVALGIAGAVGWDWAVIRWSCWRQARLLGRRTGYCSPFPASCLPAR